METKAERSHLTQLLGCGMICATIVVASLVWSPWGAKDRYRIVDPDGSPALLLDSSKGRVWILGTKEEISPLELRR